MSLYLVPASEQPFDQGEPFELITERVTTVQNLRRPDLCEPVRFCVFRLRDRISWRRESQALFQDIRYTEYFLPHLVLDDRRHQALRCISQELLAGISGEIYFQVRVDETALWYKGMGVNGLPSLFEPVNEEPIYKVPPDKVHIIVAYTDPNG